MYKKLIGLLTLTSICQGAESFVQTGSMNVARLTPAVVVLSDGRVLATAGNDGAVALRTAEIYEPATGTWRFTAQPLNYVRDGHVAVALPNGKVLIAGGGDTSVPSQPQIPQTELFDPVTETFTVVGSLAVPRRIPKAVLLQDGRVLIAGGYVGQVGCWTCVTQTVEIFNPATNTWSTAAPIPTGGPVFWALVREANGKVLSVGGQVGSTLASNAVSEYDPVANTWRVMSPLLQGREAHNAVLLSTGKMLVTAGSTGYAPIYTSEVYDPSVAPNGGSSFASNLDIGAWHHSATMLANGEVLLAGGQPQPGQAFPAMTANAQVVSASGATVRATAPMNFGRVGHSAVLLPSGAVLVVGGYSGTVATATAELFISNQPPAANAGPDQTVECAAPGGTAVTLNGLGSTDPDGGLLTYAWTGAFGSASGAAPIVNLPVGSHQITLTVSDSYGASASDTVTVTIRDSTPPALYLTLSPDRLWPPNHKLVTVTATVNVSDLCSTGSVVLASITSNEPDDGLGDGDTANDIQGAAYGTDDRSFQLRAERSGGGSGRVYTVTYRALDPSTNSTQITRTVTVPHSKNE